MKKQIRILTIQRDIRYGVENMFTEVPRLLLTGLWLKKAGFNAGEKVQVTVKPDEIILKPVKDDD